MKYFDVSMKSSSDSFERSEMFTRRTATVIISAPEASCARTITAFDGYLPVPTKSRDEKVLSAIVNRSIALGPQPSSLAAADKVHHFDRVPLAHQRRGKGGALE